VIGPIASMPPSFEILPLDLGDLTSVHNFAKAFLEEHNRLDVLVLNAAVVTPKKTMTTDGFETMFCVNHLGHFLLTNLLMDHLKRSAAKPIMSSSYIRGGTSPSRSGSKVICVGCDLGMSGDNELANMVQNYDLAELQVTYLPPFQPQLQPLTPSSSEPTSFRLQCRGVDGIAYHLCRFQIL